MTAHQDNPYKGREAVMFDFAVSARERGEHFFYVRIPGNIGPIERGDRYEDPLQKTLKRYEAGWVAGGGSQLGEGNLVEFCGIDVFTGDRDGCLQILCDELRRLNAPVGTVVEEYLPARVEHSPFNE